MGAEQSQDVKAEAESAHLSPQTLADLNQLVESEVFTVDQVRAYYTEFMRQHPTGKLKKQEFIELYGRCFPKGNKSTEFAEHLFDVFDTDHDSLLDFREVMLLCGLLWAKGHDNQLEWSFKIFDTDGDGFITRNDCREIEKLWIKQSGRFDSREVNARAHEAVRMIFHDYDSNRDGKISLEDFMEAVKKERKGYRNMTFDERYTYDLMNLIGGHRINPLDKMTQDGKKHKK